jgi:hypothetical protein
MHAPESQTSPFAQSASALQVVSTVGAAHVPVFVSQTSPVLQSPSILHVVAVVVGAGVSRFAHFFVLSQ